MEKDDHYTTIPSRFATMQAFTTEVDDDDIHKIHIGPRRAVVVEQGLVDGFYLCWFNQSLQLWHGFGAQGESVIDSVKDSKRDYGKIPSMPERGQDLGDKA